jgi:prophage antirepressor-like protein
VLAPGLLRGAAASASVGLQCGARLSPARSRQAKSLDPFLGSRSFQVCTPPFRLKISRGSAPIVCHTSPLSSCAPPLAMSQARSRSPRRDLVAASPGLLRALDVEKMQLRLDGERISKVMYFGDDDIWLEAKPLVLYLEYSPSHVTQTLGVVKDKHKKSLKELLEAKGSPKWRDLSTPGYHELKALYVNEPGLYSLIFKSTKPQAQDFQDWVYEEVLTALRRRGSYSVLESKESGGTQTKEEKLQLVPQQKDAATPLAQARDDVPLAKQVSKPAAGRKALPEACLDWRQDFGVTPKDLPAVKALFKVILRIEIAKKKLPSSAPVEAWARTPPVRVQGLARAAVSAHAALLARGLDEGGAGSIGGAQDSETAGSVQGGAGSIGGAQDSETAGSVRGGAGSIGGAQDSETAGSAPGDSGGEEQADEDVLRVTEVMRAAGVWRAVWLSYRSDLANQMLVLKCDETQGSFSERRQETVRGPSQVLVHRYRKSCDWPLAWRAVQKTRDLYEKRVREHLEEIQQLAGAPLGLWSIEELAKRIASSLRVQGEEFSEHFFL